MTPTGNTSARTGWSRRLLPRKGAGTVPSVIDAAVTVKRHILDIDFVRQKARPEGGHHLFEARWRTNGQIYRFIFLLVLMGCAGLLSPLRADEAVTAAAMWEEAVAKVGEVSRDPDRVRGLAFATLVMTDARVGAGEGSLEEKFRQSSNPVAVAENALILLCRQLDAYSRYVPREDYARFRRLKDNVSAGTGMSLEERGGQFYCFPFPGSAAEAAGIRPRDRLLAVDEESMEGRSLLAAAVRIRGVPDTEVRLQVAHAHGRTGTYTVRRETKTMGDVQMENDITGTVLRIRAVSASAAKELRRVLQNHPPDRELTLDLRGCPGGDLVSALEIADIFLPENIGLGSLTEGDQRQTFQTQTPALVHPAGLVILQDGGTASAAELLIAALVESEALRVVTQGEPTFGKGVVLLPVELRGGGYLEVVSGELATSRGISWDKRGLLPTLGNKGKLFAE